MENPTNRWFLEEWQKVDVAQSYVSGEEDKSSPTATVTETEGSQKAQGDERTSTREPHRGGCSLTKSSWEAVGTLGRTIMEVHRSSIRDGFSAWVKTDPETILKHHVINAKGFYPLGTSQKT